MSEKPTYEELEKQVLELKKTELNRKNAETFLKNEIYRWRILFEQSRDGIVVLDQNGKVYEANKRYADMLGYSMEEIDRLHVWDWDTQFSKEQIIEMIRSIDHAGAHFETRQRRKDGTIIDVELSNNGAVYREQKLVFCICRDITERKRMEAEKAELEAQNRQLQKDKSLGRMAGAIAHNFNNQLQVVIGNLEMAMDDQPMGSETLAEALKAARKAADVSALMLTYSGKPLGKHGPIDLSAACRQSLSLLQAAAPKNMIIKSDFPASGPVIRGNAGQIQQVLTNLVINAWESADENRRCIGLTVKAVSQTDIPALKRFPIDWQPQESVYACLEVADAGCGIACEDIERIFDPFYTTKFTGRGMGLSVALGIVRAHNGGITVESEPGRGSVFRVFFLLSAEEVHRQPDKPILSPEIQIGGTVLLIEDEEQVRKMVRTMLTHLGYRVLEANDGIDAVEIFRQHQDEIRCVLSDLTMPRMNGWDTLAALRRLSPDIPVILCSGYDEAHVMAGEHPEQPNAFLGKPYRIQELMDTIRRIIKHCR